MTGTVDARDRNKDIVRRLFEEVSNRQDAAAARRFWADDFVNHSRPGQTPGWGGVEEGLSMIFGAFPDFHEEIVRLVAEDDLVAAHVTVSGTHRGEFMGIPATGRSAVFDIMETFRLRDGKVIEMWVVADELSMLRQLDVLPS